jgi:hypothetical protein
MTWWIWTLIGIYVMGFLVTFLGHLAYLQMVTPPLAFIRALVWPVFFATGWPGGTPLPMD